MKKYLLSIVFTLVSVSTFADGDITTDIAEHPMLVTTLIELPSKSKITEFTGTASIGVRNAGEGHIPVIIGVGVGQNSILFMARKSKVLLVDKENTKLILQTRENGETFNFSIRK